MTNVSTGRARLAVDIGPCQTTLRLSVEAHQPSVQQAPQLGGEVSAVGRIGGEDMLVGFVTRVCLPNLTRSIGRSPSSRTSLTAFRVMPSLLDGRRADGDPSNSPTS